MPRIKIEEGDGGNVGGGGDKRMTTGSKTLPRKRPSGASRVGIDAEGDNQVGRVGLAAKVDKHDIKLLGVCRERNQSLALSLNEQLKSVRGWMKRFYEVNPNVTVIAEAESNVMKRRRNDNNAAAGSSSLVNVEEANATRKAFKGCMILLGKMLKHMCSERYDVEAVEKRMNLGFIMTKLKSNTYEYPSEFAGEMRLKLQSSGENEHEAAKLLLEIFGDRWDAIEAEYIRGVKLAHHPDHQATRQGAQEL